MSAFFITGLPRSRTAWMSAACMSVNGAMCYHEPVSKNGQWQLTFDLLKDPAYKYVGISDAHIGFKLNQLYKSFPEAPTLIIKRPLHEVEGSLIEQFGEITTNYCDLLLEHLEGLENHPSVKAVSFDDLHNLDIVTDCLKHLMPDGEIDLMKLNEFMDMNVQTDIKKVIERAPYHIDLLRRDVGPELKRKV